MDRANFIQHQRNSVCHLEISLQLMYANYIVDLLESLPLSTCQGCIEGWLSQKNHSCLKSHSGGLNSKWDKLRTNFDAVINQVDDEKLLLDWEKKIKCFGNIDSGFVDIFLLKFKCKDYRESRMKNSIIWKRNVLKVAKSIIQMC